jgi:hypothetical protein
MTIDPNLAVAAGVPAILGLVWLIRLEGKQNAHERECLQRQKNADERHEATSAMLQHMDEKLDRLIEER